MTTYLWRVSHISSNGTASPFSDETSFQTGEFKPPLAVSFDLSAHFNSDVVANPGDDEMQSLDDSTGQLVVDGFDGNRADRADVQGLPQDRVVGRYRLGDYSQSNALQASPTDTAVVRVNIPTGKYTAIGFLVSGGRGDSEMPVTFEYSDGSIQQGSIPCDDWFHDSPDSPGGPPDELGGLHPGVVPVINGMDRIYRGQFEDRNDPALFEVVLTIDDPEKELVAFVLGLSHAEYSSGATKFNLFAATGFRSEE